MKNIKTILGIIVLYKTKLEESETFKSLRNSLDSCNYKNELTLLIFNNSPEYWEYKGENYKGIEIIYHHDSSNPGVSKAYNLGYKHAEKMNKDYVLTLDQDTVLNKSFFKNFFYAEKKYKDKNINIFCSRMKYGEKLVSPSIFSFFLKNRAMKGIEEGLHQLKGLAVINSGLFVSVKLVKKIGGYNEKIKLDFSDFDFLKRAEKYVNEIVVLDNNCGHMLSGEEKLPRDKVLTRFSFYIEGAKYYNKTFFQSIGVFIWVFLRSIKLGITHNTFDFTFLFFRKIIKK